MSVSPIHVAGLKVTPLSLDAAVSRFLADARASTPHAYLFVNGQSALLRRNNPDYADALEHELALGVVDGAAVELAARVFGRGAVPRCPGPDFFAAAAAAASAAAASLAPATAVAPAADEAEVRFFLLGGAPGIPERVRDALLASNPALSVVGCVSPPYGAWDSAVSRDLIQQVKSSGANALWLGVSAPKQEVWATAHARELGMPVACVGAAFDFIAGQTPRAPKWVQALRLEWLFRLLSEPRRLWYRYLVGNTVFIYDALRYRDRAAAPDDVSSANR